ncbi:glycosyltransferase [Patescibacteria group bacterium]|nr:glycosyltransferase [Patescibacteria group bacterium]
MKIIFVDTYYPDFLKSFWRKNESLIRKSYKQIHLNLLASSFGTSDFFSFNLRKLGYDAEDLIINDEILQKKWADENGLKIGRDNILSKFQALPYVNKILGQPSWLEQIALEQIKRADADVVYFQNLGVLSLQALNKVKKYCRLLVGQIASPLPSKENLKCFDLIITSFPHYVKMFRKMGIKSEYHKLAFEPRVLKKVGKQERIYNVTFIGSFTPYHRKGTKILEEVAKQIPIHVWGQGIEFLSPLSPLRKNYHGEAWGLEMYKILAQSKIVLNRHISVSGKYANNMRLYEATGMGTMLLTDYKKNLNDLFIDGREMISYRNALDIIQEVKYFLKKDEKRKKIADAGQIRTLKEHGYPKRMKELAEIIEKYL